jgi:3-(3-hydroxy-phenyl)propionate hydroxylase
MDPVIVVGAGPVGQTAALLLARWGVPVVMLDRRPGRDPAGSKAIVQQRDVLDIWCAVGADRIATEGLTWTTSRTFAGARELFTTTVSDRGASTLPAFVNISQARTEELLDEQISRRPLIEVRWAHEVVGLDQDAGAVEAGCANGVRVRGSHAIVCAGARADALRARLGVTFGGESFADPFLICDIRADLPEWRHERRFHFDPVWNPGRQVLVHPCPDSTFRIDWQLPPGYDGDAEAASGALDRRIRAILGPVRPYELVWRSVYRFHSRLADRFTVGRVLLAGDAAHLVAPFGARGLNSGVQDAENAAWKVAFARRGWGAGDRLLESYHTERHAAARENLEVTTRTMDFLVPRDPQAARHRQEVLDRAAHDPSAHSTVDSGRLAEPYWYPDSPLSTPDPSRPAPTRPARGQTPVPAPGVLVPDFPVRAGEAVRFRQLVRDGLLALVVDRDPGAVRTVLAPLPVPVTVLALSHVDGNGVGRAALGARSGEVFLIRPDGHLAAIVADPAALPGAALRVIGCRSDHAVTAASPAFGGHHAARRPAG